LKISATIVTLNEERNIARAIESLRCADEILVVDSGSSDGTRELALRLGARVIEEPWRGYAGQKNFASQCATFWADGSGTAVGIRIAKFACFIARRPSGWANTCMRACG
jgi:glycosyltransferase involved in cell wall biosynthesis